MSDDRRQQRRRLADLAAAQSGYFTARQARELGYSYQAQSYHVGAGNWVRVDRGLFQLTGSVPDLHDDLVRWSLWSNGKGVVSHETALAVHDVGEFETARAHLTVPPGFTKQDDAVVLHHGDLPTADVVDHRGFRVTTPLRSLIDVASAGADQDQLTRAIVEARERGLVTEHRLRSQSEVVDLRAALYIERALQQAQTP